MVLGAPVGRLDLTHELINLRGRRDQSMRATWPAQRNWLRAQMVEILAMPSLLCSEDDEMKLLCCERAETLFMMRTHPFWKRVSMRLSFTVRRHDSEP